MLQLLLFITFFSFFEHAQAQKLEVALSDIGPLSYVEDGKFKGINYDFFTQIEKESGLQFKYVMYPHARLVHSIEKTQADLAIFFSMNCLKYASTYEIHSKVHQVHLGLYLKDSATLTKPHLQIGLVRGTCSRLAKASLKPNMIFEVASMDQALKMINAGHLDGVCGLKAVIDFSVGKIKNFKQTLTLAQADSSPMEAVICRKKSLPPEIKKKLDEATKKLKAPQLE